MIVVVGATASGKSGLAARLANACAGDVVNADALQLYAELELGVAKPGPELLALAPHHLFDAASVRQKVSVGDFLGRARPLVHRLEEAGRAVVVVGGTGMYVSALLDGLDAMPEVPEPVKGRIRRLIERHGSSRAHRLLARVDPALAARLAPGDRQRIGRGLEVAFGTGQRLSRLQQRGSFGRAAGPRAGVALLGVKRGRADLAERIARRVEMMWRDGMLDEARRLRDAGLRDDVEALKPIGYKEAFAVLDGHVSQEEAMRETIRHSVALAKRQETWWRRRGVAWLEVPPDEEPSVADALALVRDPAPGV